MKFIVGNKVYDLLCKTFELYIKKRWLSYIDKEANKYYRLERKTKRQAHIVHKLVDRYNKLYPEDKIMLENKNFKHIPYEDRGKFRCHYCGTTFHVDYYYEFPDPLYDKDRKTKIACCRRCLDFPGWNEIKDND